MAITNTAFFQDQIPSRWLGFCGLIGLLRRSKTGCHNIDFGRITAAGIGLEVLDRLETAFHQSQQLVLRSAPQNLGNENAALVQNFTGKVQSGLAKRDNAHMVRLFMARGCGRHDAGYVGIAGAPAPQGSVQTAPAQKDHNAACRMIPNHPI